MIPPPGYESKDNKTKLYMVAFFMIAVAVAILVGLLGAYYLIASTVTPSFVNTITNEVPKRERLLTYNLGDGVQHYERMTVEEDILTVLGVADGFIAIFDQGRGIVTFKNTTSGVCYMSRIDNILELDLDDMEELPPIFFNETSTSELSTESNVAVLTFDRSASIPPEYIAVTSRGTAQCADATYWVKPADGKLVKRDSPMPPFTIVKALVVALMRWN